MCLNETCSKKQICYRYRAEAKRMQSYSRFTPEEDGNCEAFYPMRAMYDARMQEGSEE